VRDIAPGEELTDDYGSLNLEYDFHCSCGLPECRRQVRPGDLLTFADDWDRIVTEPFRLIPTVTQPLWHFLEETRAVEAALSGASAIASVRANYVNVGEILCGFPLAR
jgi:hypothetical protein